MRHTIASLVATSDENQELLGLLGGRLDRSPEGVLPVIQSQDGDSQGANLGLGGTDGILDDFLGAKLVEEILELSLVLGKATFLGSSKGGQSREEE